jgi:RNA polymerase sigma-70 factor (ECF subfamily)
VPDTAETGQTPFPSQRTVARSMSDLSDHRLIELIRQNERGAFEALMRRYNRRLFRVARSVLRNDAAAEDAVQEAYIRAFTRLDRYKPTGSFDAWLTRIALNEALMNRRKSRAEVSLDDVDEHVLIDDRVPEPESAMDGVDAVYARRMLEHAVDALPEHYRTVFVLRAVEQLSINNTAACLGLTSATVKTRLHRAQRRLRTELARRLARERISIFDFDGVRCDRIVAAVLARL